MASRADEVWIVGASQGLGLALARLYAAEGRRVVGFARRRPVDAAFDAFVALDVTCEDQVHCAVARLYAEGRRPDLVLYLAAVVYQGPVTSEPDALLRREVETNYLGFVRVCQAIAAFKPADQGVRVVATASTLGYVGCPSLDTYSASKAALISFARSSRRELAGRGVRVRILSPPHMTNGGADLVGPQPFSVAWTAPRFARAAERGPAEHVLGLSNRVMVAMSHVAPPLAHHIMHAIGENSLKRAAARQA